MESVTAVIRSTASMLSRDYSSFSSLELERCSVLVVAIGRVGSERPAPAIDDEPGLMMGRKAASSPTDRSVAATRKGRGDSSQVRRQAAQHGVGVADVANRHWGHHPTKQCNLTASRINESSPQVIDDFSHPIPVLERELDAIEMYLGPLLDEMLQRRD
jgi:hypothetical protein